MVRVVSLQGAETEELCGSTLQRCGDKRNSDEAGNVPHRIINKLHSDFLRWQNCEV